MSDEELIQAVQNLSDFYQETLIEIKVLQDLAIEHGWTTAEDANSRAAATAGRPVLIWR